MKNGYHHKIDPEFLEYFQNRLQQVFLYITDECNLFCAHCLYKPDLIFHLKEKEIEVHKALNLISDFNEMGASKLTIIGGEPTLYGSFQEWEPLLMLIDEAKNIGYEYVRLDTNGQFHERLLEKGRFKKLDEITFSLDGPSPEINDPIRGNGSFLKCIKNIRKAIDLGYKIDLTCCIHRKLIERADDGELYLDKMIQFAESLGINRINFHDLFKNGTPRDVWTSNIDISLNEWIKVFKEISENIARKKYKIHVRLPVSFVTKEEFMRAPEYYGYCPVKLGERILIHPNGILRICALMIGTPYGVGWFYGDRIIWNNTPTNETRDHKLNEKTPCTNQSKGKDFGEFVPVCISFKPKQDEFIWQYKLKWEEKWKSL